MDSISCCFSVQLSPTFLITLCNFSKEQYVLPEDDRVIETCRRVLSVLMKILSYRFIRNDWRSFNNLPPRSPDATPCDYFLWGYVKDQVYVPPLPASIPELKVRIRTTTETITADMIQTVRNELDYHVDVCRITKVAHIEHL